MTFRSWVIMGIRYEYMKTDRKKSSLKIAFLLFSDISKHECEKKMKTFEWISQLKRVAPPEYRVKIYFWIYSYLWSNLMSLNHSRSIYNPDRIRTSFANLLYHWLSFLLLPFRSFRKLSSHCKRDIFLNRFPVELKKKIPWACDIVHWGVLEHIGAVFPITPNN